MIKLFFVICSQGEQPHILSTQTTTLGPNVEQHRVVLGENSPGYSAEGEIISTQTVSSKTRTVETITVSFIFFRFGVYFLSMILMLNCLFLLFFVV